MVVEDFAVAVDCSALRPPVSASDLPLLHAELLTAHNPICKRKYACLLLLWGSNKEICVLWML